MLSPSRITPEYNGKIRPQPDRENRFVSASGGERGIRTLETVPRLHTFQAGAFDHSAISPHRLFPGWKRSGKAGLRAGASERQYTYRRPLRKGSRHGEDDCFSVSHNPSLVSRTSGVAEDLCPPAERAASARLILV